MGLFPSGVDMRKRSRRAFRALEHLEPRRHFAAGFAPASVDGMDLSVQINNGTGVLASSGSYQLDAVSGSSYFLIGDGVNVANSSGSYSYMKNSANVGTV